MQTFLPYPDFVKSARVLDRQRLGKQRVEVLQLLRALQGQTKGWVNHPAAKMWRGHEQWLAGYGVTCCEDWLSRGYKDTCKEKITALAHGFFQPPPTWMGDAAFHRSHQSNLVRKAANHYGPLFPGVPSDLPYVWPR